jgi:hypothetical protein
MEIIQKNWTLNDSLSLIERVVLHNLKLYESFEDKVIYFEKYYNNLIKKVFNNKNYIVETYNRKFTRNLIMESNFDFQNEIKKTHNFIKKSIKFDTLLEQEMNVGTIVTQPRDTVGPQVASQKQAYNPETQKYETLSAKIGRIGWEGFFQALREGLTSTWFTVTTFVTDLIPGAIGAASKVVGWIAWGILTLYDAYEVFIRRNMGKIPNLIGDFIGFLYKARKVLVPSSLTAFVKDPSGVISKIPDDIGGIVAKASEKLISRYYVKTIRYFATQKVLPAMYDMLKASNEVISWLGTAVSWFEKQLNSSVTWISDSIKYVQNMQTEIMNLITEMYPDAEKSGLKLDLTQKKQEVGGITRDSSTPIVNPNFKFNPSASDAEKSGLKLDVTQKKQEVGGITRDNTVTTVNPKFQFNPPKNKT